MAHDNSTGEGFRKREKYRGANLYVILLHNSDGELTDLVASVSSAELNLDQNSMSNIEALAAMTSLALREYEDTYVAAKLLQAARGPNTLPSIFANVILENAK